MLRSLAAAGLFACVASSTGAGAFAQGAPEFNLWWHGESALSTFLRQPHPGVTMITPGEQPTPEARSIKANGYAIVGGIGGGSARQAQTALAGGLAALEHAITRIVASGATYIFVDEPSPAPGQSTATSPDSIAYNVKGFNIVYDYIHERYPGVMMGLTIGDDGGAALHLSMLKAGLKEDFASAEYYNSCCADTNPFAALKAQFPAIKTMILAYHTETLCQLNKARNGPWIPTDGVDIWAFWDVDNYGGWIGPEFDGSWLQNVETFASTGSVESFCVLPFAFDPNYTYEIQRKDFTHTVWDRMYWASKTPYVLDTTRCEYKVMSGMGAINGPDDPSLKVTAPWTRRPCNGTITITVGADGNCNVPGKRTCVVFVRNYTTTGLVGDVTFNEYSVQF